MDLQERNSSKKIHLRSWGSLEIGNFISMGIKGRLEKIKKLSN